MSYSQIAKKLGQLGGRKRAIRLSKQRRQEIARLGARARLESLRLVKAIQINFDYLAAIQELSQPPPTTSLSEFEGRLPDL